MIRIETSSLFFKVSAYVKIAMQCFEVFGWGKSPPGCAPVCECVKV